MNNTLAAFLAAITTGCIQPMDTPTEADDSATDDTAVTPSCEEVSSGDLFLAWNAPAGVRDVSLSMRYANEDGESGWLEDVASCDDPDCDSLAVSYENVPAGTWFAISFDGDPETYSCMDFEEVGDLTVLFAVVPQAVGAYPKETEEDGCENSFVTYACVE